MYSEIYLITEQPTIYMNNKINIIIGMVVLLVAVIGVYLYSTTNTKLTNDNVQTVPAMSSGTSTENVSTEKASIVKVSTENAKKEKVPTTTHLATLTDAEWKQRLTPDQYAVLREGGTESPYTSPLLHETRAGTFVTADCGELVFRSEAKFDSGTGWPSFYKPIKGAVIEKVDTSLGVTRTEIVSAVCHSHLGHVFSDAPQTPTGLRYCMNGVALVFVPDKK